MTTATILLGDVRERLRELPDSSVHTCITSPPYYGLRDYGEDGQIGLEQTPAEYVDAMVAVFREVWRILRDDGTLWLNLGDSYYNYRPGRGQSLSQQSIANSDQDLPVDCPRRGNKLDGYKEKDLLGIPWRVAFALQADGWYLRQDIIWHKPNPMPESVADRCTKAHEYVFLLTKSPRYYFDHIAIKEPANTVQQATRNKRDVWSIPLRPFKGAHFAVMPETLVEPCIAAGLSAHVCATCHAPYKRMVERAQITERRQRENRIGVIPGRDKASRMNSVDMEARAATTVGWTPTCQCEPDASGISTVLDPFTGSGTVAVVAMRNNANFIGTELNIGYAEIARQRIEKDQPLMNIVNIA